MTNLPLDLTAEEHQRIFTRNQFALRMLSERVGFLTRENVELLSIIDELQRDLGEARNVLTELKASGDILHPDPGVASEHAVVHGLAAQQSVPGRDGTVPRS